jgi:hypothetical protein
MATWIKCTNTKRMTVYINLDNAVTVMRDDTGQRIDERGTVIEFMGGEQVYIVVTEQPEEIIKLKSSAWNAREALSIAPKIVLCAERQRPLRNTPYRG